MNIEIYHDWRCGVSNYCLILMHSMTVKEFPWNDTVAAVSAFEIAIIRDSLTDLVSDLISVRKK